MGTRGQGTAMTIDRLMRLLRKCPPEARVLVGNAEGTQFAALDEVKFSKDPGKVVGVLSRSTSFILLLPIYDEKE